MKNIPQLKHAYCIIAHSDLALLNKLLMSIDDNRNDIFLLIDSKSSLDEQHIYQPKNSVIHLLPRHNILWGHISLVEAELELFSRVLDIRESEYGIVHLISGQDLPLHSQNALHKFVSEHRNINFLGCNAKGEIDRLTYEKTHYYHPFTSKFRVKNFISRNFYKVLRTAAVGLQKSLGIQRDWKGITINKGCNWASLTPDFCEYLVSRKDWILKHFKGTWACDEIYKQTLAWNSAKFKPTLSCFQQSLDKSNDCILSMRKIDWERGKPYVWKSEDFDELMSSPAFFARKFNSDEDSDIINRIYDEISKH